MTLGLYYGIVYLLGLASGILFLRLRQPKVPPKAKPPTIEQLLSNGVSNYGHNGDIYRSYN